MGLPPNGFQDRLVMTTSILLQLYVNPLQGFTFCVICSAPPRYVLLRCPKFFARCSLCKISTAATPYASLLLPLAALGNVPTSKPSVGTMQQRASYLRSLEDGARRACSSNPLSLPHSEIDKLACQAQSVGIFAAGELSR